MALNAKGAKGAKVRKGVVRMEDFGVVWRRAVLGMSFELRVSSCELRQVRE